MTLYTKKKAKTRKFGTEKALKQAQELLRTILSPGIRVTTATVRLDQELTDFLAAYGVDGETDLTDYAG